ncbi:MAG: hypothetical protein ACI8P2_004728, partial [Candidatus Latescibacterota bacterium]
RWKPRGAYAKSMLERTTILNFGSITFAPILERYVYAP